MIVRARDSRSMAERFWWAAPVLVFVIATLVSGWAAAPYLVGVFHDDGIYALLAQSIASGHGFHYSHLPGAPAATHYPPLYPLMLSMLWRVVPLFPDNLPLLLGFNALLVGIAAAGFWFFARTADDWNPTGAALAAIAGSLALPTLALAGALLSETLFLAGLWACLVACERALRAPHRRRLVIAGVAVGLLMLVRTHGVALLAAIVILLLVRREWRAALVVLGCAAAVQLPWMAWSARATPHVARPLEGAYGSYLGWFVAGLRDGGAAFLAATSVHNARESWLYFEDRFAAGFPAPLQFLTIAGAVASLLAGAVHLWSRARVVVIFLVLYIAIMFAWPYNPWRFVWAIWPLIVLVIAAGVRSTFRRGRGWRPAAIAIAVLPLAAAFRVELHAYSTRDWRTAAKEGAAQIAPVLPWAHANVGPNDVILSEGEAVLALYEGFHVAPPASFTAREYLSPPAGAEGAARLAEMLRAVPARAVILFNPAMIRSAALLRDGHPGLAPAKEFRGGVVFAVVP